METDSLARLLAEPLRLRAFAAIALGATTPAEAARLAGMPERDATAAVRRLLRAGVVVSGGGGLRVEYEALEAAARREPAGAVSDDPVAAGLRPFISDGRLTGLPAQQSRRRTVLAYLAEVCFEPGVEYDEPTVNDKLKAWSAGADVDHVAIRRYMIDMALLTRSGGVYKRSS
jgi:hypothetical protein